jgi:hypothetical protein
MHKEARVRVKGQVRLRIRDRGEIKGLRARVGARVR